MRLKREVAVLLPGVELKAYVVANEDATEKGPG